MTGLHEKAEKAFQEFFPAQLRERVLRTEFDSKDATLIAYARLTDFGIDADPFELLRRNADPSFWEIDAPIVYDAVEGRPAIRIVLSPKLWSNAERMKQLRSGGDRDASEPPRHSGLRLLKGIPEQVACHTYGRSGRLSLLLDKARPLLAVVVFTGGLFEASERLTEADLRQAAWVLLARSGVSTGARSFHLLRAAGFFRVERAAEVPESAGRETLKMLESDLLREAEEDRHIISALLRTEVAWLRADVNPTSKGDEPMSESAVQTYQKVISAKMIDSLGNLKQKKVNFSAEDGEAVDARHLKKGLLDLFKESSVYEDVPDEDGSVALETENDADADKGFHLTALDETTGKRRMLSDDESVDLGRYTHFELSPRTSGGDREGRL